MRLQGVGNYEADAFLLFTTAEARNADVPERQKAYVRKITAELNRYDNVIYDICDEPTINGGKDSEVIPWILAMKDAFVEAERALPNKHVLGQTVQSSSPDLSGDAWCDWLPTEYVASAHDGGFSDAREQGKRLFLRLDLDKPYPMNYGLIGIPGGGETDRPPRCRLGLHPAEFYTAHGNLDPGTLTGSSVKDLTGQGWILQKSWDKDPAICKSFELARPGSYNQMLVVWDAFAAYENDRWSRLEMFGVETPDIDRAPAEPKK